MDGAELLKIIPKAIAFFSIDNMPGVITKDNQAWLFEGGVPHPITQSEIKERDGVPILADDAAALFDQQPGVLDFLKKK